MAGGGAGDAVAALHVSDIAVIQHHVHVDLRLGRVRVSFPRDGEAARQRGDLHPLRDVPGQLLLAQRGDLEGDGLGRVVIVPVVEILERVGIVGDDSAVRGCQRHEAGVIGKPSLFGEGGGHAAPGDGADPAVAAEAQIHARVGIQGQHRAALALMLDKELRAEALDQQAAEGVAVHGDVNHGILLQLEATLGQSGVLYQGDGGHAVVVIFDVAAAGGDEPFERIVAADRLCAGFFRGEGYGVAGAERVADRGRDRHEDDIAVQQAVDRAVRHDLLHAFVKERGLDPGVAARAVVHLQVFPAQRGRAGHARAVRRAEVQADREFRQLGVLGPVQLGPGGDRAGVRVDGEACPPQLHVLRGVELVELLLAHRLPDRVEGHALADVQPAARQEHHRALGVHAPADEVVVGAGEAAFGRENLLAVVEIQAVGPALAAVGVKGDRDLAVALRLGRGGRLFGGLRLWFGFGLLRERLFLHQDNLLLGEVHDDDFLRHRLHGQAADAEDQCEDQR